MFNHSRVTLMQTVKTLAKGQIVIPSTVRERYGIKPGSRLEIREAADHIEIYVLPEDPVLAFRGSLSAEISLADSLIEEHRSEVERDG